MFESLWEDVRSRLRYQIEELRAGQAKVAQLSDDPNDRWTTDVYQRNIAWRERLLDQIGH